MATSEAFQDQIRELMAPLGVVTIKRMFGGSGIYLDGLMFALSFGETLYLKVDGETRAAFEAAGSARFVYEARGKSQSIGYWSLPEEAQDDPEAASGWARLALDAALRSKKPKTGKAARRDIGPGPWDG